MAVAVLQAVWGVGGNGDRRISCSASRRRGYIESSLSRRTSFSMPPMKKRKHRHEQLGGSVRSDVAVLAGMDSDPQPSDSQKGVHSLEAVAAAQALQPDHENPIRALLRFEASEVGDHAERELTRPQLAGGNARRRSS